MHRDIYKCLVGSPFKLKNDDTNGYIDMTSYVFSYTAHVLVVKFVNHRRVWEQGGLAGAHGPRARSPVILLHIGTPCPRSLCVG